ncbi:MAG: 50S ribosomal protein L16 [Chitinophagales bacterium]|nr:50S ribosomal protein L16 [Chitinophagales bacterium]MDW8394296.1 50S ribosomal protein L16 [Chitinophagales bacterium]
MLQPKKTKYRKSQKGRIRGNDWRGSLLAFGSFGLKALESAWVTDKQLEAARVALTRHMKREGQVWIRVFPDKPITKKPLEVRMGKGKGNPEGWVAVVRPGRILFEAEGVSLQTAREAMKLAADKLPVLTRFVVARDFKAN